MFRFTESLAATIFILALTTLPAFSQTVVATTEGESPGIRIEITELSRTSGDTVTLKYRLFNETGEDSSLYFLTDSDNVSGVHLIDAVGKKKYLVITDSDGNCLCSAKVGNVASGQYLSLWAKFPAPPADVMEVGVVFPHFIPTDAPISE